MPRLGVDKGFLLEFARLDRPVQDRVHAVFAKFEHATHTGLHLEKVRNGRDAVGAGATGRAGAVRTSQRVGHADPPPAHRARRARPPPRRCSP